MRMQWQLDFELSPSSAILVNSTQLVWVSLCIPERLSCGSQEDAVAQQALRDAPLDLLMAVVNSEHLTVSRCGKHPAFRCRQSR